MGIWDHSDVCIQRKIFRLFRRIPVPCSGGSKRAETADREADNTAVMRRCRLVHSGRNLTNCIYILRIYIVCAYNCKKMVSILWLSYGYVVVILWGRTDKHPIKTLYSPDKDLR